MKDRLKDKINTVSEEKRFSKRYVMLTLMIIAFFVTIIMVYYNLLYNEKRTNIIKSGEMAANNSADQLDKYLSTNIDSLKLTAYTLDGMLDENKSDEEIQDFLVGQSTAIRSAVIENSTGLYGYINGRFFSGTNWEPPEDYVATVRPWYLKPLENPGQITILDPYVDVQSGNTMLALGKTLKDGVSVVSVDVSLDQVQKLMEDAVASGDSDIEMILNDKGVVVAHSDRSEVGKDYNTEYDTLGSNILSQLHGNNTDSFEIHFQGSHYIVYVAEIRNSWRCISINDATSVFSSLSLLLAVTIAVVIAVVVIISIIMARSNRRRLIAEHLSTQLSSTSDIYISMHEIDFLKDTFSEVRNSKAGAIEMIGKNRNNCQQTIRTVMDHFCDPISKNDLLDFVDFSKLDNRLKDSNTITMEFLSAEKQWRRARFIVSGRLPDGRVSRAMYLVEDIDEERRRREKSLEEINILNTRISSIANIYMTAHELDVATDTFSEMKTDSRNISDLIGRTRKDAQGTLNRVMETVCDESCIDDVMRFIDLSTLQERLKYVDTIIIEYMNKDKVWRRGRFVVSGRDETGSLTRVLWLTEDIDNEKKERDMIIEMSERAIAANQAKSSFLSNMSHEIRTPINAVLGMNEMILRECDDKTILAYSDSIRTAGHTLLELVNDILDFSKIEAGKMEIIPAEYALSSMLNDLVNLIQPRADEKLLSLILDFDKDIPGKLFGDEVRIKQIITNILTNAVKYTEKGSVVFTLRYEKDEAEPDYIYLKVSVKDTGIGIKKENMDRLFSEFERIEEDKNRHVEGTGLGMSITRTLLNMMDSSLDVDSVYGLGSKFSFRLRQRVIDWEPLGDYETAYRQTLKELGKYKESFSAPDAWIMVVDDNPMNLMVFKSLLKQTRVHIDTAGTGDEGLSLSGDKKYDIIFLDHMMPEKDGIETLHEMRTWKNNPNADTPVVCLTANAIAGARENYIDQGFDDYMTKPIDPVILEEMLLTYLPKDKIKMTAVGQDQVKSSGSGKKGKIKEDAIPAFVQDIDELDTAVGIKQSGSTQTYLETLRMFAGMSGTYASQIEDYVAVGDMKNATIKIHSLKSTLRIIGAADLGELAQKLENAGKSDDRDLLDRELGKLLKRTGELGNKLMPLTEDKAGKSANDTEKGKTDIGEAQLKEEYKKIKALAEDCDNAGIEEILDRIKALNVPENERERLDALTKAVDDFDFEAIIKCLK